ncbi:MAG: SPFH/Band 7/PHB domain protein, partial [Verrucomicrobiota bacterium]
TAEQQAAIEFAKAAAMRPQIVGLALKKISQDPDISRALFNVLETQNIIGGEANITLIPKNSGMLGELVAASQTPKTTTVK